MKQAADICNQCPSREASAVWCCNHI